MKIYSIILLLLVTSCKSSTGPIPFYKSKIINVGTISLNHTFHGSINLTNIGDQNLKINKITSDCECTIITDFKKTIEPKSTTNINFELTPHMTGYDQQNIFIMNNSNKENIIMIAVRAKVEL